MGGLRWALPFSGSMVFRAFFAGVGKAVPVT
jgi:hypothetical protein